MRVSWFPNAIRPFTVGVVVIMIIAGVILNFKKGPTDKELDDALPNINQLLDQVLPKDEDIQKAFRTRLSPEALRSHEAGAISRDGQLLRLLVSKPEGSGPFPVVIIVHQQPSSIRTTNEMAELWGEWVTESTGMMSVTVDWRESSFQEEELTDLLSTIDWVGKLVEAEEQPVYLIGFGHGAYLSFAAFDQLVGESSFIDGIMTAYGYSDVQQEYNFLAAKDQRSAKIFLDQTGCASDLDIETCLKKLSVTDSAITVPLLVMHARYDSVVSFEQAALIAAQATDQHTVTSVTIEDQTVGHDFLADSLSMGFEHGQQAIKQWLLQQ